MINVQISKNKYINRWVDWENLIYAGWNSIKNFRERHRHGLIEEKEVRHEMKQSKYQRQIREIARTNWATFVLNKAKISEKFVSKNDSHPTKLDHRP